MEWKSSSQSQVQAVVYWSCILFLVCQLAAAYPAPEDYEQHDQGMREILAEFERQGGLTAPMVPRAYMYRANPNHQMMRKSQRSNTLRLRFGKRSADFGLFQDQPQPVNVRFQPQRYMEPKIAANEPMMSNQVGMQSKDVVAAAAAE